MKTLIVYSSKYGTTQNCAKQISEKLNGEVDLVNIRKSKNIDISNYDKIVIGSSVYVGKVHKKIKEFCVNNIEALKNKKLGIFICCMEENDKAYLQIKNSFPKEILDKVVVKEYLGGEFRFKKMNFLEKFVVKNVSKNDESKSELDTSKDISSISNERIIKFSTLMNEC